MRSKHNRTLSLGLSLNLLVCCCATAAAVTRFIAPSTALAQPKPSPAPARWRGLIGEYGPDDNILIILEKDGKLWALFKRTEFFLLSEISKNTFGFPARGTHAGQELVFTRDAQGRAKQLDLQGAIRTRLGRRDFELQHALFDRRQIEPESGNQLHVTPLRPVVDLMKDTKRAWQNAFAIRQARA